MDRTDDDTPLGASHYTDVAAFEADKDKIFYRTWQCVCHVSEVAEPGAYASFAVVDEDIFVIRAEDGRLNAFYNICRHRGHPLVAGRGRATRALVCPYHAWTYRFDGALRNAPAVGPGDRLSRDQIRLRPIAVEEFCSFVFVNLDPDAAPLAPQLAELDAEIRSYHPDPARLRFVCETTIEHACNWKISVENYNECYHCPTVHASSLVKGVLSLDGYTTVPRGRTIWHEGKAQTSNERQYDYDTQRNSRAGDYGAYWIWPNVAFTCYPGGFFSVRQWLPRDHRRTTYLYRWFSDGELPDAAVEALMKKHKETTGAEDEVVVGKIQKGMESRAFEPGPYILGDGKGAMSEVGLRHFHKLYREARTS